MTNYNIVYHSCEEWLFNPWSFSAGFASTIMLCLYQKAVLSVDSKMIKCCILSVLDEKRYFRTFLNITVSINYSFRYQYLGSVGKKTEMSTFIVYTSVNTFQIFQRVVYVLCSEPVSKLLEFSSEYDLCYFIRYTGCAQEILF